MLTNASIDELEEPSDEDGEGESGDGEHSRLSSLGEKKRHKRRTSRDTDLLSKEQMNQVGAFYKAWCAEASVQHSKGVASGNLCLHGASGSRPCLSVALCTLTGPSGMLTRHTGIGKEHNNKLQPLYTLEWAGLPLVHGVVLAGDKIPQQTQQLKWSLAQGLISSKQQMSQAGATPLW